MNVNVVPTSNFERKAKKLIKKYRSLKGELAELTAELESNPRKGTHIRENVYKIRLAVKSKGKGKNGGMRVITYIDIFLAHEAPETDVYILSIYDKSENENIGEGYLTDLVDEVQEEVEKMGIALGFDRKSEEEKM